MSASPTNRTVNIYINSNSAEKSMEKLQAILKKTKDDIARGTKAGDDMTKQMKKLGETEAQIDQLNKILKGEMAPTFNMLKARVTELDRELKSMSKDAPGYAAKFSDFKKATAEFKVMQAEIKGVGKAIDAADKMTSSWWSKIKLIGAGSLLGNMANDVLQFFKQGTSNIVADSAKLSDSLSDIQKATDLSEAGVQRLNAAIGKINTRTLNSDLRDIAVGLGQIGEAATPQTVASIDKIVVALGDEFGGGAKEITTTLGILRNNLQDLRTQDYGADVLHIGNALNVLGAEGLATAPVVVNYANRMAGIAGTFKLTSGEILGLSATMQELGVDVERGSTAITKLFQKVAAEPKKFAEVAGMGIKEFGNLVNNDMLAAFNAVAVGAGKAGEKNTAFATILKELDADGSGAGEALSKLAKNQEMLAGKVALATEALTGSSSVISEFNNKNNNLAANLSKLQKIFTNFLESPAIGKFLNSAVLGATAFATALTVILGNLGPVIALISLYAFGWAVANKQLIIQNAQLLYYNARIAISTAVLGALTAAQTAYTLGLAILTMGFKVATPAIRIFSQALAASPLGMAFVMVGFLAAGITVLVAVLGRQTEALKQYTKAQLINIEVDNAARKGIAETQSNVKMLTSVINDHNASQTNRLRALNELKAMSPEVLQFLTLENIKYAEGKKILEEFNKQLYNKAALEAAQSIQSEKLKKDLELQELEYTLQQKISNGRTDISDLDDDEKNYVGGARKSAPFAASVVDALKGSKNSSAALEAITVIKAERARLANEIDATNEIVKERYEKLGNTVVKGARVADDSYTPTMTDAEKRKAEAAERKAEALRQKKEDFLRKFSGIAAEADAANINRDEAEIQRVHNKYVELTTEAEQLFKDHVAHSDLYTSLTEAELKELETLYKKHFKKRSDDEYDATLKKVKIHFDIERQTADKQYLAGEISQKEHSDRMLSLDEEEYNARALVAEDYADTVEKAELDAEKAREQSSARRVAAAEREKKRSDQEKLAGFSLNVATAPTGSEAELEAKKAQLQAIFDIESQEMDKKSNMYLLKQDQLNRSLQELDREYLFSKIQIGLEQVNQLMGLYANYSASLITKMQNELNEDRAANDKKRDAYKKQLDQKKISQAVYDKALEKMEAEQAEKELAIRIRQFNSEKEMKLVQGGMDLASGIMNIWSKHAANPIMAGILTGALSAISLFNMAIIESAEAPKFKYGRMPVGKGGVPEGPDHTQGGIKLVDSQTGMTVGEMEGREPILSVDTYNNNPEIVDALVDTSMNHGGRKIKMPWLYQQVPKMNTGRAIAAMQYNRMYSNSNAFSASRSSENVNSGGNTPFLDERSMQIMERWIASMDTGVRAHVYYNDIDHKNKEMDGLKKAGSIIPAA